MDLVTILPTHFISYEVVHVKPLWKSIGSNICSRRCSAGNVFFLDSDAVDKLRFIILFRTPVKQQQEN